MDLCVYYLSLKALKKWREHTILLRTIETLTGKAHGRSNRGRMEVAFRVWREYQERAVVQRDRHRTADWFQHQKLRKWCWQVWFSELDAGRMLRAKEAHVGTGEELYTRVENVGATRRGATNW